MGPHPATLLPQVLTYYSAWSAWRNAAGALGTKRMAKFITQNGTSTQIRVNYAPEPRSVARSRPWGWSMLAPVINMGPRVWVWARCGP